MACPGLGPSFVRIRMETSTDLGGPVHWARLRAGHDENQVRQSCPNLTMVDCFHVNAIRSSAELAAAVSAMRKIMRTPQTHAVQIGPRIRHWLDLVCQLGVE